jgi:hypothetical protein
VASYTLTDGATSFSANFAPNSQNDSKQTKKTRTRSKFTADSSAIYRLMFTCRLWCRANPAGHRFL